MAVELSDSLRAALRAIDSGDADADNLELRQHLGAAKRMGLVERSLDDDDTERWTVTDAGRTALDAGDLSGDEPADPDSTGSGAEQTTPPQDPDEILTKEGGGGQGDEPAPPPPETAPGG